MTKAVPELSQFPQIVAKPPRDQCSKMNANCLPTKCCRVTGYNCFYKKPGIAHCMKTCTPGVDGICTMPEELVPLTEADKKSGMSLFCFSVYTQNTGTTKPSYELALLKLQHRGGHDIFSCEEWGVYSDVVAPIAPGINTVKVDDALNDWHFAKRKSTGAWVNTGMFFQVWKKISAEGNWASHDWVIKVDADAVFIPSRLVKKLSQQFVPEAGLYYTNCKYVDYGFFGNLEVFSHDAWSTFLVNLDSCYNDPKINWKVGIKNGMYGPMGEDLFAQSCMDQHGVKQVEAFDITMDGTCPGDRPQGQEDNKKWIPPCTGVVTPAIHPFKKPEQYTKCLEETTR